ncbi:MAG TPA: lipopolysaccharide biosynthesis protein [Bradyrhizobium sp.]
MIKRLIQNTVISTVAFGAAAILGLIVIPVIIRTWGVTEFGLIVITRLLLPSGMMAVLDFGLSEVATQVVARAREHRDWDRVGRQLSFLTVVSILLAVTLSASIWLGAPYISAVMKVDAAHADRFISILHYTALANLVLVPALVWEGTVKGFERYNLLRLSEFTTTLAYVALTVWASTASVSFEIVAYIFLATLVARALAVLIATIAALTNKRAKFGAWTAPIRRELSHRCLLLLQGKLIGGITGPIQPLLVGLLFGPTAVGIYDALVRLSRVSKAVVSLLTSALLPVASRLDERGSSTTFQRLGELGLVMLPMLTLPPLAAAAILSPQIMQLWIGPLLAPYASWMGVSFVIPICAQYLTIGSVIFLTRTEIQARLNLLLGLQLFIWAALSAATVSVFAERAFILGQAVASLVVLPWQIETQRRALDLDRRAFARAMGTQLAILAIGSILLWISMSYIQIDSLIKLALVAATFCLTSWVAQYFLVLDKRHRAVFPAIGHLMGVTPRKKQCTES